ncbi:MAG TPA: amino acid ABC transporter permease [Pseudonocardiaceae bacterium]|nr:amino acid ABC transporter permease [Pseudonocardiaceae bacterium]
MSSVLYDLPGPRARARNKAFGLLATLGIVALAGFISYRFWVTGQFEGAKWEWLLYKNLQLRLFAALGATLRAFVVGALLALVLGLLLAVARLSEHVWLRTPAFAIVEFFRAIPLVIMIFFLFFAAPQAGLQLGLFWSLVVGLTLYNGSVLAEVFRAGVLAVPRGQREAAYSLGMRKNQVMRAVLLPQAVRAMLPTIVSQLVVLLKDTALGFLITYQELLFEARYLGSLVEFERPIIPTALVIGAIYITLCVALSLLAGYLERRNRRRGRSGRELPIPDVRGVTANLSA